MDPQRRPLVHSQQGGPRGWAKGIDGQRHEAGGREFVHLANGGADGRRRVAAQHRRGADRPAMISSVPFRNQGKTHSDAGEVMKRFSRCSLLSEHLLLWRSMTSSLADPVVAAAGAVAEAEVLAAVAATALVVAVFRHQRA